MGCNCKDSNNFEYDGKVNDLSITQNIIKYTIKTLAFLLSLIFLPIIMIGVIWFLFDILVLNKNVDLSKVVSILAKNIKKFNEDYDDYDDYNDYDDYDDYDEEDYVTINVEEITDKTK